MSVFSVQYVKLTTKNLFSSLSNAIMTQNWKSLCLVNYVVLRQYNSLKLDIYQAGKAVIQGMQCKVLDCELAALFTFSKHIIRICIFGAGRNKRLPSGFFSHLFRVSVIKCSQGTRSSLISINLPSFYVTLKKGGISQLEKVLQRYEKKSKQNYQRVAEFSLGGTANGFESF